MNIAIANKRPKKAVCHLTLSARIAAFSVSQDSVIAVICVLIAVICDFIAEVEQPVGKDFSNAVVVFIALFAIFSLADGVEQPFNRDIESSKIKNCFIQIPLLKTVYDKEKEQMKKI